MKYSLNNLNSKIMSKSKQLYYGFLHELVSSKNDLGVGLRNRFNIGVGSGVT